MSTGVDRGVRRDFVAGGRASKLARWQTAAVIDRIRDRRPHLVCTTREYSTHGDAETGRPLAEIGGQGVFTEAIERALLMGEIDLAVHSLKDLPVDSPAGLTVGAILGPRNAGEALISRNGEKLAGLPVGAVVGTSSLRRRAQLLAIRPDLRVRDIRGNVETRIAKVARGDYDATLLAVAGIQRLGLQHAAVEYLDATAILPAPGQGAIAVQCRADDAVMIELLREIDDRLIADCAKAERSFLQALGGGCSAPVGALAVPQERGAQAGGQKGGGVVYRMMGRVVSPDGSRVVEVDGTGEDPERLGKELARRALEQGAGSVLRESGANLEPASKRSPRHEGRGPLFGRRVVVTRPEGQADEMVELLEEAGAEVINVPAIRTLPLPESGSLSEAFEKLATFDWILFASRNAVEFFHAAAFSHGVALGSLSARIGAVGSATAEVLRKVGIDPDFVSAGKRGASLAQELPGAEGATILLPCAVRHSADLPQILRERGGRVILLPIYRTEFNPIDDGVIETLRRGVDWILFTSGSTVSGFVSGVSESSSDELLVTIMREAHIACIGPATEVVLREAGFVPEVVAGEHTGAGLVAAILEKENEMGGNQ